MFFINIPVGLVVLFTIRRYLPAYHLGRRAAADRLPRRGAVHRRARPDPRRADQQAVGRLDRPVRRRADRARRGDPRGFVFVESRAAEPIVPLGLFRNRAFTVSVGSVFLAAFGFFAAVVFLPRWFQVVNGSSATISGYQMLPLLGGVIVSAVASGQIVAGPAATAGSSSGR